MYDLRMKQCKHRCVASGRTAASRSVTRLAALGSKQQHRQQLNRVAAPERLSVLSSSEDNDATDNTGVQGCKQQQEDLANGQQRC